MKKINHTIFTMMLFLICITNTYAACTQEDFDNFKKVEDEYTVKYEFDKTTKTYKITFHFSDIEKYSYDMTDIITKLKYENSTDKSLTYSGLTPGEYTIKVISLTDGCNDELKTIELKLPKYNNFSEDPLCEGIEEFVLCSPTYGKELDYETFVSRVNTYKKTKEKKETQATDDLSKGENSFLKYIEENIWKIIIVLSFIILLTITIIITAKSIKDSRRLD